MEELIEFLSDRDLVRSGVQRSSVILSDLSERFLNSLFHFQKSWKLLSHDTTIPEEFMERLYSDRTSESSSTFLKIRIKDKTI